MNLANGTPANGIVGSRPTICEVLHSMRVGGAEVLAARLARQLGNQYRFVFACLDEIGSLGEDLRAQGFAVHLLGRRPGMDWRCAYRLRRLLRQERVDLIHAHQYTPFFYALLARVLSRGRPLMFTEHGRHFPDYPRRKRMVVNRLMLRSRDRVVAVGNAVKQALIDNEGIRADRVSVIYNGIDLDPYRNGAPVRESVRRELGLEPTDFVLLQVARLDYLKDHATAVRTMRRVIEQAPHARLLLAGEGPEEPPIRALVHELNLDRTVRFLGLRNDVSRLLRSADCLLLSSISEGIPLTVIEGMAAGLPVVSTKVGGITEVVEEDSTGLLAPAGDDAALAMQVLRLVSQQELRYTLGQNGRRRAEAIFAEPLMHAGYCELFVEMLRA